MTRRTLQRTALRAGAVVLFLVLAGATYQGVATALERRTFQRSGGMVDVGGHQLHIHCTGEGSPTVILEAPAAGMSAAWGRVQPEVARVTRVCAYDRTGLGWSERSDASYDPSAAPGELHTLLARANEAPPFVVAGHGLGAAFATLFAARPGTLVPAIVLVDPPSPSVLPAEPRQLVDYPAALPWLARTGIMRLTGMLLPLAEGMPQPSRGALTAFLWRPDHLSRTAEEMARWRDIAISAREAALPATTRVVALDVLGSNRVGFLATAQQAAPVVSAILDAVRAVRQGETDGAAMPDER